MRRRCRLVLGILLGMLTVTGCKRAAELPEPPKPAPLGPLVLQDGTVIDGSSTAEDVAWAFLQTLKRRVEAARSADPARRREALRRAESDLLSLVWNEGAAREIGKRLGREDISIDPGRMAEYVLRWPATVAHYVEGFRRDRLSVHLADDRSAVATLTAAHPGDRKVAQALFEQITEQLRQEGLSGSDLDSRRTVLLRRELAERGIGYPVAAVISISMAKVEGYWRVTGLTLQPFRLVPGGPGPIGPLRIGATPATRPATAPAEPAGSKP